MKKILLSICIGFILPLGVSATESMTSADVDSMVNQMKTVIDQYATRIKYLEQENAILRNEVMKAGIKIPLSAYSGNSIPSSTNPSSNTSPTTSGASTGTTAPSTPPVQAVDLSSKILADHPGQIGGFMNKIHADWPAIQSAYKLQTGSYIGAYEFVKTPANNQVFVDIMYGRAYTGTYDAKILYEYNTGTFQRKLVGFFEFDPKSRAYITRTGNNPHAGKERNIILDPYISKSLENNTTVVPTTTPITPTETGSTGTTPSTVTFKDVEKAYTEKRYLSVISLSNTYLASNPATYDILRIRYRTFFIIGKYDESIKEIQKIETLGKLDKTVACDAQAIATYGVNQTLSASYAKLCAKK
jgi:hypothetical protein